MANYNRPTNAFPKGNQLHKQVAGPGRKKQFTTPDDLWKAATTYFEYCTDNPISLWVPRRGKLVTEYRMQAMSLEGLCLYLGITDIKYYRKLKEFDDTISRIKDVIYVHNFTAAITGILNGRIISKTLK